MNILKNDNNTLSLNITENESIQIKNLTKDNILQIANNIFENPSAYEFNEETIDECQNTQECQLTKYLVTELKLFKNSISELKNDLDLSYSQQDISFK